MAEIVNLFDTAPVVPVKNAEGVDINFDDVLGGFEKMRDKLDHMLIIGSGKDGQFYFASSSGDTRQIIYDIQTAEHITMNASLQHRYMDYEDEE